jgi:hypothetical protein
MSECTKLPKVKYPKIATAPYINKAVNCEEIMTPDDDDDDNNLLMIMIIMIYL